MGPKGIFCLCTAQMQWLELIRDSNFSVSDILHVVGVPQNVKFVLTLSY